MKYDLILVSKSPRRKILLKKAGLNFEVASSSVKEKEIFIYDKDVLSEISRTKALSIAHSAPSNSVLISADTVVVLDGECLKKPENREEAFLMLKRLSGRVHSVYTSITVFNNKTKQELTQILETKVAFRKLKEDEIEDYIEKFNPLDKAGSYGIQDFISEDEAKCPPKESFIKEIEGDYENVMGISTKLLMNMLEKI